MSVTQHTTRKACSAVSLFSLSAGLFALTGGQALADMPLYANGDFSLAGALTVGAGAFAAPQANFGTGTYKSSVNAYGTHDQLSNRTPSWAEGYAKPELKATYHNGSIGTIFGDVSAVYAGSLGQGEAATYASTYGHPSRVDLEEAYIGYSNDMPFGNPGDTAILTLGRQAFNVGDNFLIGSGTTNYGQRSNYWMAPRTAFNGLGTLKLNAEPVRADVFVLENTVNQRASRGLDQPKTDFAGLNVEYFITAGTAGADGATNYADRQFYFGGTYFNIYDAQTRSVNGVYWNNLDATSAGGLPNSMADRKGMNVFDAHFGGNPFSGPPIVANASLYGEYVRELNDKADHKVNANAYYIEPGYAFPDVWGKPKLSYRYAHFSGDAEQTTGGGSKHAYDALFYSAGPRDFGSWFMGEIAGQYQLFNTNEDVHMVSLSATPTSQIKLIATYYRFMLDHAVLDSTGQQMSGRRHYADEVDLVAEYAYTSSVNFALVGAAEKIAGAARDQYQSTLSNLNNGTRTDTNNYTYQVEGYVTIAF